MKEKRNQKWAKLSKRNQVLSAKSKIGGKYFNILNIFRNIGFTTEVFSISFRQLFYAFEKLASKQSRVSSGFRRREKKNDRSTRYYPAFKERISASEVSDVCLAKKT